MKKILLATTMLVGTAGFAAAEGHITFAGSAAAGIASDNGGDFETYSSVGLDVTFSGSTDGGLTFGATFGASAGRSYDFGADPTEAFADESGAFGMPEVFIEGSFGRIAFSDDDYDMFDDANGGADVDYSGTFGAVSVGLRADVDSSDFSAQADATFSGITLHADADTYGEYNASASYTMGSLTGTVGVDQDSAYYLTGVYAAGSITAEATYNSDASWDVALDYAANGMSAGVTYDSDSAYEITAGYDLGGGLSLEAGYNSAQNAYVGAAMSF